LPTFSAEEYASPRPHGFEFIGYAVRAGDGRYVSQELPRLLFTPLESLALAWELQRSAFAVAKRVSDPTLLEVWHRGEERLMRPTRP